MIVDEDGKRSLVTRTADGKRKTQKLSNDFKSNPTTLAFHDADQDGLADLVVLIPYEKVKVLRQRRRRARISRNWTWNRPAARSSSPG